MTLEAGDSFLSPLLGVKLQPLSPLCMRLGVMKVLALGGQTEPV